MAKPKIVICMGSSCFARGNEKTVEACENFLVACAKAGFGDVMEVALGADARTGRARSPDGPQSWHAFCRRATSTVSFKCKESK